MSRLLTVLAALGVVALGAPAAAADDATQPAQITVTITDTGFDQPSYTIPTSRTNPSMVGIMTIVNKGSTVHTASRVPGSTPLKVGFGTINFLAGQTTNIVDFDTGGIAPNQSKSYGLPFPGTYQITSATDCLNGNHSARFNCAPVTLQVADSGSAAAPQAGAAVDQSSLTCAKTVVEPNVPELCVTNGRQTGQTLGSPSAGVGDSTIVVDEQGGFHPSVIYLKVGSTITWVNQGQQPHDVAQAQGQPAPDGFHVLDSGVMKPGASYSYTYNCPPGPISANTGLPLAGCTDLVGPLMYWSNIGSDQIGSMSDGFGTTTTQRNTNSSLYIGAVYLTSQ